MISNIWNTEVYSQKDANYIIKNAGWSQDIAVGGSGFTGTISITNNTDTTVEDWSLEFDFNSDITNIWNGVIEDYPEIGPTFNYSPSFDGEALWSDSAIAHFYFDMLLFYWWGNIPK